VALLFLPGVAFGFCHEIEVVRRIALAPAGAITVEWVGHATFEITSSKGTRILTDPHGRGDLPSPNSVHHIVTSSHPHGPHSSVWMARGNPVILHGLTPGGENWNKIHQTIRDVSVYTVPAFHDKSQGLQRGKNAIFVFRVDGVCIAHLGDLGHHLTPEQVKMLGKIDILLVPIAGGMYTVTASEAMEVTKQVNPRIAIPMHYWWDGAVEEYIRGYSRVRKIDTRVFSVSKNQLPSPIEVVVVPWNHR
jgi:L-ascorbate metabolism protein UlaG (beta-lactamase superfamily)